MNFWSKAAEDRALRGEQREVDERATYLDSTKLVLEEIVHVRGHWARWANAYLYSKNAEISEVALQHWKEGSTITIHQQRPGQAQRTRTRHQKTRTGVLLEAKTGAKPRGRAEQTMQRQAHVV